MLVFFFAKLYLEAYNNISGHPLHQLKGMSYYDVMLKGSINVLMKVNPLDLKRTQSVGKKDPGQVLRSKTSSLMRQLWLRPSVLNICAL